MRYLDKQWDILNDYTNNGLLRIDNNLVENSIRPFAMGRKSWLLANSAAGASANIYSRQSIAKQKIEIRSNHEAGFAAFFAGSELTLSYTYTSEL